MTLKEALQKRTDSIVTGKKLLADSYEISSEADRFHEESRKCWSDGNRLGGVDGEKMMREGNMFDINSHSLYAKANRLHTEGFDLIKNADKEFIRDCEQIVKDQPQVNISKETQEWNRVCLDHKSSFPSPSGSELDD